MYNKERDQDRYLDARKFGRKAHPRAHLIIEIIEMILPPVTGIYLGSYLLATLYLLVRDGGSVALHCLELALYFFVSGALTIALIQGCWLVICSNYSYFFFYNRTHLSGIIIGAGLTLVFVVGSWMLGYEREILTLFLVLSAALYLVISLIILAWAGALLLLSPQSKE